MEAKKIIRGTVWVLVIIAFIAIGFFGMKKIAPHRQVIQTDEYNGFNFTFEDPLWMTKIQMGTTLYQIRLWHWPKELENITIEGNLSQYGRITTSKGLTYLIIDDWGANDGVLASAVNEIGQQFRDVIHKQVVAACSSNDTIKCYNFSMIKCEESDYGAIHLTNGNETKIVAEGNCITITGTNSTEIIKATERLFYHWYGIMKQ